MKLSYYLLFLLLLTLSPGVFCSKTVNPDTLASVFLKQFEKTQAINSDSANRLVTRYIQQLSAGDPDQAGLALCKTGLLLNEHGHDNAALKCLQESLPFLKAKKYPHDYIQCMLAIADVFYKAMIADSASHYVDLAHSFALKEKISDHDDDIFNDKARIADLKGQRLLAIDWYLKAADLQRKRNDSVSLGIVLDNIGLLYLNMKNYTEALKYFQEAERYNQQQKNESNLNNTYINLAIVYNELHRFRESIGYYQKSIVLSKKLQNEFQLTRAFMNLGNAFMKEKRYDEAAAYFDSSKSICVKYNIQVGLLLNKINEGQLMLETGRTSKGLALLLEAEKELEGGSMPEVQSELWRIMSTGYETGRQFEPALTYYRKHIALRDTISGEETKRHVLELMARYESEHSARMIDQLQQNIEKQKTQKRFALTGFISSVMIIILLLIVLVIYKRAERYKRRLAQEENEKLRMSMELKDQELVSKAMNMSRINQVILDVSDQFQQILPWLTIEKKDSFHQMLKNLENSIPSEAWKEFETRFEQVHKGFYNKLLTVYPDLTPTELKICGFLRLNLTTKDIALLTNRSIGTIDHSRSSIRRKMNLDNEVNLTTFLHSF